MHSNKLDDGRDPVELGAYLRDMLEAGFRFEHQHTATWLNPAGVKATLGYSSGSYRLSLYNPGQVGGSPIEIVDMSKLEQASEAASALARWARVHPTPIGLAS